jgi:argininosuccinate lyase
MSFAPAYISNVLSENFEDAKVLFFSPLMSIHYAHLVMLARTGIVSGDDARVVRDALDRIPPDAVRAAVFDGSVEDLFCYVERLVVRACGDERAGRLHTARSRNDIDMTMYRMRLREYVLELLRATLELRRVLVAQAARHRETILGAHTHTQPAQPTTIAHYLLGVIEERERDGVRLRAAYETTNRNPLGACAITGTGFPIDRHLTSELLGFAAPTGNTYGSIATVDYLLEASAAAGVTLVGVGRFIQDLLQWCTLEFGYLRLGEGHVQSSSIMPQKRNPVALEHARAIGSKAVGQGAAIVTTVHNTPFGDIVDTEDDLQPLVYSMFKDATRAVTLVGSAMASAEFDAARLEHMASQGWITVTELADTLTREQGLPFKTSHTITVRFVLILREHEGLSRAEALRRAAQEVIGRPLPYDDAALDTVLSPRHFVTVRRTLGGPAPDETAQAIALARAQLSRDELWLTAQIGALKTAEARLRAAADAI